MRLLCVPIIALGAIAAAIVYLLPVPENWFLAGATASCIPWTIAVIVRDTLGLAPRAMGAEAEDWTSRELGRFARFERSVGVVWHVIDDIPMDGFNVDHVLIGPGGVFALETKWSAAGWDGRWAKSRIESAARTVRSDARTVKSLLRSEPHRLNIAVQPIVVLWGRSDGMPDVPDIVVFGNRLRAWLSALRRDQIDPVQVEKAIEAVRSYIRLRDQHDSDHSGTPRQGRLSDRSFRNRRAERFRPTNRQRSS